MNQSSTTADLIELDTSVPVWEQFFTVAPLVLVGTTDPDGALDMAPKHMVTPMGWQNYFGFVCTPAHGTCSAVSPGVLASGIRIAVIPPGSVSPPVYRGAAPVARAIFSM